MRKRKAGEKGDGAGKKEKGGFLAVFFLVCTFSILRTRLSRSLEHAAAICGSRVCGNSCPRKGGMSAKEFNSLT